MALTPDVRAPTGAVIPDRGWKPDGSLPSWAGAPAYASIVTRRRRTGNAGRRRCRSGRSPEATVATSASTSRTTTLSDLPSRRPSRGSDDSSPSIRAVRRRRERDCQTRAQRAGGSSAPPATTRTIVPVRSPAPRRRRRCARAVTIRPGTSYVDTSPPPAPTATGCTTAAATPWFTMRTRRSSAAPVTAGAARWTRGRCEGRDGRCWRRAATTSLRTDSARRATRCTTCRRATPALTGTPINRRSGQP